MRLKQTNAQTKMSLPKLIKGLFSKNTPNYIRLIIGVALAYTFLPVDMLPDLLGPLGFADDIAVVGLLTTIAVNLLETHETKQQTTDIIDGDDFLAN